MHVDGIRFLCPPSHPAVSLRLVKREADGGHRLVVLISRSSSDSPAASHCVFMPLLLFLQLLLSLTTLALVSPSCAALTSSSSSPLDKKKEKKEKKSEPLHLFTSLTPTGTRERTYTRLPPCLSEICFTPMFDQCAVASNNSSRSRRVQQVEPAEKSCLLSSGFSRILQRGESEARTQRAFSSVRT